ncbi:unnamed protein product [Clonostachys rosea f. rosea IK726]|uniref:Uncharacterized protein n=1 Tax=Clonostachys rosea f. rosea IK726 TaxID=1349383 RepID=A0ACA9UC12_BIOOC|nr:unnamed protein product [Clonostachys rosea f. rosea IK726]
MSIFADAMATGDGATATNAEAIASLALPFLVDGNHDHPESMAANTGADDGRSMAIDEATYDKGTVVDAGAATTPGQAEPIVTSGEAVGSDEEATDDEATDDEATDDEATHQTITADEEVSDEVTGIDAEITAPAMASNDEAMAPCVGTIATEAKAMAFNQEATDDEPAVAGEETRDVATTAADTMATAAIAEATTADAMTADAEDMVAGEAAAEDTTPGGTTIRHPRTAKRKCIEALSPLPYEVK